MPASEDSNLVRFGDRLVALPWPAMEVVAAADRTFVLLDPDAYLLGPEYKRRRRSDSPALRNLWAFDDRGNKLWEAELPEPGDYYYKLVSANPVVALAFSSWRCSLSPTTGQILQREFLK